MKWKEFLKPTLSKIILTSVIFISLLLVLGIPVEKFPLCKMGAYCPKIITFISIQQLLASTEFIGRGIWLLWHLYVLEFIVSYFISSIILFAYKKYKK